MNQIKTNYFYIDESGNINNNSELFLHGCIKTDSPNAINKALQKIKNELENDIYFEDLQERILNEGFHATENHIDMRTSVYKVLPLLDYRAYFVITNKKSEFFKEFMKEKDESEFFKYSLKKLIKDRITKNKNDINIFYFETIELQKKSLKTVLNELFEELKNINEYEYHIVGKEEENMGIIDYLNYLIFHVISKDLPMERMQHNFKLVAPKIALIALPHNGIFLSRKKPKKFEVSLDNLIENFR